jgi:hypothetical protein
MPPPLTPPKPNNYDTINYMWAQGADARNGSTVKFSRSRFTRVYRDPNPANQTIIMRPAKDNEETARYFVPYIRAFEKEVRDSIIVRFPELDMRLFKSIVSLQMEVWVWAYVLVKVFVGQTVRRRRSDAHMRLSVKVSK